MAIIRPSKPLRLVCCTVSGLILACAVGAQTISMVATKRAPETAQRIFPANSEAIELAAYAHFKANVQTSDEIQKAAMAVQDEATGALRANPTAARAMALLALSRANLGEQDAALIAASRVNRRDLFLQTLVLEAHLRRDDNQSAIETLDQILRVHPSYLAEFFPTLAESLGDETTISAFRSLLDGSSPWHQWFLVRAVGRRDTLPNLARLRALGPLPGENFDRRLIEALANQGQFAQAVAIHRLASAQNVGRGQPANAQLGWASEFPPIDWLFADESGFRAQQSRDGQVLEIYARAGKGGTFAQRLIPAFDSAATITVETEGLEPELADQIRLSLRCAGTDPLVPALDQELTSPRTTIAVSPTLFECDYLTLEIKGRARTGGRSLNFSIVSISVDE